MDVRFYNRACGLRPQHAGFAIQDMIPDLVQYVLPILFQAN